ncbi:MAG TPA: hypothetical protein VFJ02_07640 [Vicinamibacterales bacterium]|nr:hypothetical protein [Vicinamibacterales bacterium]
MSTPIGHDDHELVRTFEAGNEPQGGFHHREHVRVAWYYLLQHPLPDALSRFSARLRNFAAARGKPGLYHETITVAYILFINERLDGAGRTLPWEQFAATYPELLSWKPSLLDRYYTPATLSSERARRTFVMPDKVNQ